MTVSLNGTTGVTYPDGSVQNTVGYSPWRNRIINGDMRIDQRNNGASVTVTSDGQYTLDRFQVASSSPSKVSVQRNAGSITPPAGFSNYIGVTSLAATTTAASDYYFLRHNIEGFNTSDFGFGAAGAATVTLSFWVRSSLTGTFGGSLLNSAENRSYPFSYTISAANTWEYKTVVIAGDTAGTWIGATNGIGMRVVFSLGVGSNARGTANAWANTWYPSVTGETQIVGTNGATFYITGVQLEAGTTATPFERVEYGEQLRRCQRYYEKSFNLNTAPVTNAGTNTGETILASTAMGGNSYPSTVFFRTSKRATPTITLYNRQNASNNWAWYVSAGTATNGGSLNAATEYGFNLQFTATSTYTVTTGHWDASAEL